MAQDHLDPLPAGHEGDVHVALVAAFAGPPPAFAEVLSHVRARLPLVPRARQRLVRAPAGLGPPRWIDDPRFNLEYHVRHAAVPQSAGPERTRAQLGRLLAQRLDRTKPLWELWVLEDAEGAGWSLVSKTHLALVADEGARDLMTALLDDGAVVPRGSADGWVPRPEPSPAQLAALGLADVARRATVAGAVGGAAAAVRDVAGRLLDPAPPSPLCRPVGPHRRIATADLPLADLKRVKDALGASVNDVVLALVATGIRRWMHERGVPTAGAELRAAVPVSTDRGLTQVVAPLPIAEPDPVARVRRVSEATADLKSRHGALGADLIAAGGAFAPPTVLARALRERPADPRTNVLVANVPGPQSAVALLGRRLEAVWPVAPLTGDRALAVAAMSYAGTVHVGLTADLDTVADVDVVADGIRDGLAELLALGEPRPRQPGGRRRPVAR